MSAYKQVEDMRVLVRDMASKLCWPLDPYGYYLVPDSRVLVGVGYDWEVAVSALSALHAVPLHDIPLYLAARREGLLPFSLRRQFRGSRGLDTLFTDVVVPYLSKRLELGI